jgi:membrane-bound inhibitor of C-type lysozyme
MNTQRFLILAGFTLSLTGCGSVSVWPFGDNKASGPVGTRGPENATEYRCAAGRHFHVRILDGGKSAWVFLPDRQVRLDQVTTAESGHRYSNGVAVLRINGSEGSLTDGPSISYLDCKTPGAASQ